MKFLIASDIHGSATWCRKFIDAIHAEKPDKIILLGDILYHGPRNALPDGYDPKEVIALLNPLADRILAVRGNCDAEVDQMVLDFPCMADCSTILDPEYIDEDAGYEMQTPRTLFLTHGHVFGPDERRSNRQSSPDASQYRTFVRTHPCQSERTLLGRSYSLAVQPW